MREGNETMKRKDEIKAVKAVEMEQHGGLLTLTSYHTLATEKIILQTFGEVSFLFCLNCIVFMIVAAHNWRFSFQLPLSEWNIHFSVPFLPACSFEVRPQPTSRWIFYHFPSFIATFHRSLLFRRSLPFPGCRPEEGECDASLESAAFVVAAGAAEATWWVFVEHQTASQCRERLWRTAWTRVKHREVPL